MDIKLFCSRLLSLTLFLGLLAGAIAPGSVAAERPSRVVSLNLCADQLLLRLADRDQIASLSPLSRDPSLSYLAREAETVPINDGKGESILFSGADLVLTGTFGQQGLGDLLKRQGFDVQPLEPWRSIAHGREQIRRVAARLGHPDRGEALIAAIEEALWRTRAVVSGRPSILTSYRSGWVPASDSLISEILRHMGFASHQESIGVTKGGVVRLEALVMRPPDYLLLEATSARILDMGSAFLVHPALRDAVPARRRLVVDGKLAICGGPSTPALIDTLAAQARERTR